MTPLALFSISFYLNVVGYKDDFNLCIRHIGSLFYLNVVGYKGLVSDRGIDSDALYIPLRSDKTENQSCRRTS